MTLTTKAIIFDLGSVLIDWNPRHLYRKLFGNEQQMEHFLTNIANMNWNEEQDMGRSLQEGTEWLVNRFPEHEAPIRAYYGRWEEMLGGPIEGTLRIFKQLKEEGHYKLYALSNWSAEMLEIARPHYDFLNWFDALVISGLEKHASLFRSFISYCLRVMDCSQPRLCLLTIITVMF